jgi:hypothetical protein
MRKKIEELFGEAKEFMGLRQAKFRRTTFVREQVLMTATAQNIKRMIKMLFRRDPERGAVSLRARPYRAFNKLSRCVFDINKDNS